VGVILPLLKVEMPSEADLIPALSEVLYSGTIGEGEYVYEFERRFAKVFMLENCLAVSSGTAALHLALIMAGVKNGSKVITTSMTAEPTNTSILQSGGIPLFADVNPCTGNIDPASVSKLIHENRDVAAIMVVHYAGYPAEMDAIRKIGDTYSVPIIEDCAHALGAQYKGRPIGSLGDYAIFSFQAIKHLTTVDGGMLVVRDSSQVEKARKLRWFGLSKGIARTSVDIENAGFKYNMNNVTAAIGLVQLDCIEARLSAYRSNGLFFDRKLSGIAGMAPATSATGVLSSYWLYTLCCDDSAAIVSALGDVGVTASKVHRPNHLHSVFKPYSRPLPNLDLFYSRLVHIPCGPWVGPNERELIARTIEGVVAR
jgi:perosamine synthetase